MSTITLSDIRKELVEGILQVVTTYKGLPMEYPAIYESTTKTKKFLEFVLIKSTFTKAQQRGEQTPSNVVMSKELYETTFRMNEYGNSYEITHRAMHDNLYQNQLDDYNEQLKNSFKQCKEEEAVFPYNVGFDSAYPLYDGQPFFSANHPVVGGGVQSNTFVTPTDLNLMALELLLIKCGQIRDEGALNVNIIGEKLGVGLLNMFVADVLLDTKTDPSTANRAKNPVNRDMFGRASVPDGYAKNRYFANQKDWFLYTNIKEGRKHFERESLNIQLSPPTRNRSIWVDGYECYTFGISNWRTSMGVSGQGNMFGNLN